MPRLRHPRPNGGFGSIELVIAVVILGMIFLFTLKGTVAVASMRAFVTGQQINTYKSAMLQYQTDFNAVPGDDTGAPGRWDRDPSLYLVDGRAVAFVGDARINGLFDDSTNPSGEQFMAWHDLRSGGYVEGDRTLVGQTARPENLYGGVYGFAEGNLGLDQVLCLTQVPGTDAALIDRRLDDASISTGQIRGTSQWDPVGAMNRFDAPDSAPYDPEKTYIICTPYVP